eukprot:6467569-Amphidinium_carterae.3
MPAMPLGSSAISGFFASVSSSRKEASTWPKENSLSDGERNVDNPKNKEGRELLPDYVNRLGKEIHDMTADELAELQRAEDQSDVSVPHEGQRSFGSDMCSKRSMSQVESSASETARERHEDLSWVWLAKLHSECNIPLSRCKGLSAGSRRYLVPVELPDRQQKVRRNAWNSPANV